mmetsp:Transcript_9112/g.30361  ORF Transcript_9112/g.30361 Transcript_9112/m.30361 type:complete len:365 (+) Transcript_9112:774-1868(+)
MHASALAEEYPTVHMAYKQVSFHGVASISSGRLDNPAAAQATAATRPSIARARPAAWIATPASRNAGPIKSITPASAHARALNCASAAAAEAVFFESFDHFLPVAAVPGASASASPARRARADATNSFARSAAIHARSACSPASAFRSRPPHALISAAAAREARVEGADANSAASSKQVPSPSFRSPPTHAKRQRLARCAPSRFAVEVRSTFAVTLVTVVRRFSGPNPARAPSRETTARNAPHALTPNCDKTSSTVSKLPHTFPSAHDANDTAHVRATSTSNFGKFKFVSPRYAKHESESPVAARTPFDLPASMAFLLVSLSTQTVPLSPQNPSASGQTVKHDANAASALTAAVAPRGQIPKRA